MYKKTVSLWRYLRTPVLLTSATVFAFGCASKNPLIDEADPVETSQSVPVLEEPAVVQKEYPVIQNETVQEKIRAATPPERSVSQPPVQKSVPEPENELNSEPTGMKKWLSKLSPYRTNIQQGNFISSEMLAKIQPGMTKEQVRFVLGTPLLTDMFHANRWDYLFRLQKPNGATTTNRVTVFFSGNTVNHLINDRLPDEAEYLSHITSDDESSDKVQKDKQAAAPEQEEAVQSRYEETAPSAYDNPEARPEPETAANTVPAEKAEPEVQAVPMHAVRTESVQQPKPVSTPAPASIPAPVRAPEPASTPEPVRPPAPAIAPDPYGNIERAGRPIRQGKRPQVKTLHENPKDGENTASENLDTFESISTPSRVGKMLPPSPNDELIGNIQ